MTAFLFEQAFRVGHVMFQDRKFARFAPLLGVLLAMALPGHAQTGTGEDGASPNQLEGVTIRSNRDLEARFAATGSRVTIGRSDIEAMGANTVGDVLRQTPGLQVTTTANGGLEIRMRGMGPQNTRIQMDGVPVSTGNRGSQLPLDELPSDLIERIEVIRAPTAETQGAAGGTLNIVLRSASVKRETYLWLTDQIVWGKHAGSLFASQTGPLGAAANRDTKADPASFSSWSYFVSLAAGAQNLGADTVRTTSSTQIPGSSYSGTDESRLRNQTWTLIPRITGRLGAADRLIVRGLFSGRDQDGRVISVGDGMSGGGAFSSSVATPWTFTRSFAQVGADWSHSFKSAKWDTTLQLERSRNDYDTTRHSETLRNGIVTSADSSFVDDRVEKAHYLNSKLTAAQGANLWTFGGEYDLRKMAIQSSYVTGAGLIPLDQTSSIRRAALWGQIDIPFESIKTTTTLGLRAQDFRLEAQYNGADTRFSHLFWQPSINSRTALNETTQMRWNLARIGRNPRLYELVNAVSPNLSTNGPNNPDFQGNPNLKPQTTITLDAGIERRLAPTGQVGVNLFLREQRDVIARRQFLDAGRWVEQPDNIGGARVWGIEADLKTGLGWIGLGPQWNLSANASLLQSRMRDGVAAGERIPGQARYLANVSIAKPLRVAGGWYGGGTLSLVGASDLAGSTSTATIASGRQKAHAQLDLYIGSVLPNIGFWRLNIFNITDYKQDRTRTLTSAGTSYTETTVRQLTPRVFLTFGTRF